MAASKNPLKAVDFSSPNIKAQPTKAVQPQTQSHNAADWSGLGNSIASIGNSVAQGLSESKNAVEEIDKQMTDGKTPPPKKSYLERRIDRANAKGKKDKVARLTGKLEKRNIKENSKKQMNDAEMLDKEKVAKSKAEKKVKAAKAKASEETSTFNANALENRKSVTQDYMNDFLKSGKQYDDNLFSPLTMKQSPVLQKLGSTGKGFKLRAFKNN